MNEYACKFILLPPELVEEITGHLDKYADLAALTRTCRRMHTFVDRDMYQKDYADSGCHSLTWSIEHHATLTLVKWLQYIRPDSGSYASVLGDALHRSVQLENMVNSKILLAAGADVNFLELHDSPLTTAAHRANDMMIDLLLRYGALPNLPNQSNITALWHAADAGWFNVCESLLQAGANALQDCKWGETPMFRVAVHGYLNIMGLMMEHGVDVDATIKFSRLSPNHPKYGANSMFYYIATNGHLECLQLLYKRDHDQKLYNSLHITDSFSELAATLQKAASRGHCEIVESIINYFAIDITDPWYSDILPIASGGCNSQLVACLLRRGVDPNVKDSQVGPPIVWATCANSRADDETVAMLLKAGADPNALDSKEQSAFHHAATVGHEQNVCALLAAGADATLADWNGRTPLMRAAGEGRLTVVKCIISLVPENIEVRDANGMSALSWAVSHGHAAVVNALLESGAQVDTPAWAEIPLLTKAVCLDSRPIVMMLLNAGVNINLRDEQNGRTALHMATQFRHIRMFTLLLENGADPDLRDDDGRTAIDCNEIDGPDPRVSLNHFVSALVEFREHKSLRRQSKRKAVSLDDDVHET